MKETEKVKLTKHYEIRHEYLILRILLVKTVKDNIDSAKMTLIQIIYPSPTLPCCI